MARDTLTFTDLLGVDMTQGGEDQTTATLQITDVGLVFHEDFNPSGEEPLANNATKLFATYPTIGDMRDAVDALGFYGGWIAIPEAVAEVRALIRALPSKLLNTHAVVSVLNTTHSFDGSVVVPEAGEVNAAGADFGCGAHLDPSLNVPAPQLLVV